MEGDYLQTPYPFFCRAYTNNDFRIQMDEKRYGRISSLPTNYRGGLIGFTAFTIYGCGLLRWQARCATEVMARHGSPAETAYSRQRIHYIIRITLMVAGSHTIFVLSLHIGKEGRPWLRRSFWQRSLFFANSNPWLIYLVDVARYE